MRFSRGFLEELRARAPIAEIIGRRVALKQQGGRSVGLCPFHDEKTPSFHVVEAEGFYHCFGCKASGDAVKFLQEHERLPFPEAVEQVARAAGMQVPTSSPEDRARQEQRDAASSALAVAERHFREQLRGQGGAKARDYLASRGVGEATAETFGLGFAPPRDDGLRRILAGEGIAEEVQERAGLISRGDDGRAYSFFRDRLMFPIRDRRGRTIAFGGRALGEARAKYLNSRDGPLFHKGRTLFNLDRAGAAARKEGARVRIVEGYMDVIALSEAGFPAAVAPLGTALTPDQIAEAWRLDDEPVLCMDGDEAGRRAAVAAMERALPALAPGKSLGFAFLPAGQDPDSLYRSEGPEALERAFGEARPLADLAWDTEFARQPVDTPERRAHFQMRIERLVEGIGDGRVRGTYRTFFAQRYAERIGGQAFLHSGPARAPRDDRPRDPGRGLDRIVAARHKGRGHDAAVRRERALLRAVINVEGLVDGVVEALAEVPLVSGPLDELRKEILDMHTRNSPIDPDSVRPFLERLGLAGLPDCSVGSGGWDVRSVAEPFTRPGADPEEALRDWESAARRHHQWHEEHARRTSERAPAPAALAAPGEGGIDDRSEEPA